MGKIVSLMLKPIREFNIESRAQKAIERNKLIPAPKLKVEKDNIERMLKEYPDAYKESLRKNENLDEHLKSVYVKSYKENKGPFSATDPNRPLPTDRRTPTIGLMGYDEPKIIKYGTITLLSAFKLINAYKSDRKTHNTVQLAEDYRLPEEVVSNIIKYFNVFEIYEPVEKTVKNRFIGPKVTRTKIVTIEEKKLLESKHPDK